MPINKQYTKLFNFIKKICPSLFVLISLTSVMLLSLAFTTRVNSASIVVTTLTDEILDDDLCSLREAIINSNDDAATHDDCAPGSGEDSISFSEALGEGTIILTSALPSISDLDGLSIDGDETISISGNNLFQVFIIELEVPLELYNLTISNGYANEDGGVIYNEGKLTISNCNLSSNSASEWMQSGGALYNAGGLVGIINSSFNNNSAYKGGGIANFGGELNISTSIFSFNSAETDAGGIYNQSQNLSTIESSQFINNSANYGGGIYNQTLGEISEIVRNIYINNCIFSNNIADSTGGGVYSHGGKYDKAAIIEIDRSTFSGNSAFEGGAACASGTIYVKRSTFQNNNATEGGAILIRNLSQIYNEPSKLANSTFLSNSATEYGGAVSIMQDHQDNPSIFNCTLYGNSAGISGGGIKASREVNLINNIIAGSHNGGDCVGDLEDSAKNNLIEDYGDNACKIVDDFNGNIIGYDPYLGPPTGSPSYLPLLSRSLAIDAGDDAVCSSEFINNTSQNSVTRPYGSHCDIGSYELNKPIVLSIERLDPSPTNAQTVNFLVTFTVPVSSVDITDFFLTSTGISGASMIEVSGSEDIYSVSVDTGSGDGSIRLDLIDDDSIIGPEGEFLGGDGLKNGDFNNGEIYEIDKTVPLVESIAISDPNPTKAETVNLLVNFSEPVTGLDTSDFSITAPNLTGTDVTEVLGEGISYTVTVYTGSGSGSLRLDLVDNDTVIDEAGNKLGGEGLNNGDFTTGESYTIDRIPPYVVSSVCANPNPTTATTVYYIVTFSEPVTGVDLDDFSLTTNSISHATVFGVSGSGKEYTVAINTGTGNGTIRLDINDDDSIQDIVLNTLGGEGLGNGDFVDGEVYIINYIPYTIFMPLITNGN